MNCDEKKSCESDNDLFNIPTSHSIIKKLGELGETVKGHEWRISNGKLKLKKIFENFSKYNDQ